MEGEEKEKIMSEQVQGKAKLSLCCYRNSGVTDELMGDGLELEAGGVVGALAGDFFALGTALFILFDFLFYIHI